MAMRSGGVGEFDLSAPPGWPSSAALEEVEAHPQEVRVTVLEHIQRGGATAPHGQVLATRFGVNAADAAHAGEVRDDGLAARRHIGRVPLADAVLAQAGAAEPVLSNAAAFFG